MSTGKAATTASSSRFRRRPKTSRSSDVSRRTAGRTGPLRVRPASSFALVTAMSTTEDSGIDAEPFPGEPDEQILQARRDHAETAHPYAGPDQLRADLLRLAVPEQR